MPGSGGAQGSGSSRGDRYGAPSSGSSDGDAYDSGTSTGGSGRGTYRSRDTHRPTPTASPSGDTAGPMKDGTAALIHCASMDDPYATVEVRNPNGREGLFTVRVSFKDEHGFTLIDTGDQVSVPAKDKATLRVPVAGSGRVDEIDHCEVNPRASADR